MIIIIIIIIAIIIITIINSTIILIMIMTILLYILQQNWRLLSVVLCNLRAEPRHVALFRRVAGRFFVTVLPLFYRLYPATLLSLHLMRS